MYGAYALSISALGLSGGSPQFWPLRLKPSGGAGGKLAPLCAVRGLARTLARGRSRDVGLARVARGLSRPAFAGGRGNRRGKGDAHRILREPPVARRGATRRGGSP